MHRIERISISRAGVGPAFSLTARATARIDRAICAKFLFAEVEV